MNEQAFFFPCRGDALLGILHPAAGTRGVVVVVGGPQYRVGSHRQFLLLARDLAAAGIPVLRFDYRGMGDSGGEAVDFTQIDADIAAAVDTLCTRQPQVREVVLWGLCDAASAILFYAWRDARVGGVVLLNPWVHTDSGRAKAYLKHYYLRRLFSRDLWAKIGRGEFDIKAALHSLAGMVGSVLNRRKEAGESSSTTDFAGTLPERMAAGRRRFRGRVLVILSGNDLVAAEFRDTVRSHPTWRGLLDAEQVTRRELPAANHTFSQRDWRDQVTAWTLEWLQSE